jgi:hypothetical protein
MVICGIGDQFTLQEKTYIDFPDLNGSPKRLVI